MINDINSIKYIWHRVLLFPCSINYYNARKLSLKKKIERKARKVATLTKRYDFFLFYNFIHPFFS